MPHTRAALLALRADVQHVPAQLWVGRLQGPGQAGKGTPVGQAWVPKQGKKSLSPRL